MDEFKNRKKTGVLGGGSLGRNEKPDSNKKVKYHVFLEGGEEKLSNCWIGMWYLGEGGREGSVHTFKKWEYVDWLIRWRGRV